MAGKKARKKSGPDADARVAGQDVEPPTNPGQPTDATRLRPRRAVRPEPARYARTYRLTEDTLNTIEALLERAAENGEKTSRERIVEHAVAAYAQQAT